MSTFTVHAATLRGMEAILVQAEVDISSGLPGITIVGIPDSAVLEARYRIRCAFKAANFDLPRSHITVNLAPSDLRKTGSGFDLPIAVAILASTGQIPLKDIDSCLFVGELSLQGDVGDIRGGLAYALLAKRENLKLVGNPSFVQAGMRVIGESTHCLALDHLSKLKAGLDSPSLSIQTQPKITVQEEALLDYAEVADQEPAKRALVIAATGKHGLLMMGPPGSGKTMLARRLPTILPPLEPEERLEAMLVWSVSGLELDSLAMGLPPFRSPHHSSTIAGLVGGNRPIRPGEVSLAHKGILFLDELPEFASKTLQTLRQPLEDKRVVLVRAEGTFVFPSDFQLIAAANPCPCGHLGDPGYTCKCSDMEIHRYQGRIGGALLDRIDLFIDVARPRAKEVIEGVRGSGSASMKEQVIAGREFATKRLRKADCSATHISGMSLSSDAARALEAYSTKLKLGGRAIFRVARVARTIADLRQSDCVKQQDIAEACSFRCRFVERGDDA